jgi:hypothetical protein
VVFSAQTHWSPCYSSRRAPCRALVLASSGAPVSLCLSPAHTTYINSLHGPPAWTPAKTTDVPSSLAVLWSLLKLGNGLPGSEAISLEVLVV